MKRESYKSIGELLGSYVADNHLEDGLLRVRVYEAWDRIVAAQLAPFMSADKARSMTIGKSFYGGVLRCSMASSVVRSQLRAQSDRLVRMLNNMTAPDTVKRLILA